MAENQRLLRTLENFMSSQKQIPKKNIISRGSSQTHTPKSKAKKKNKLNESLVTIKKNCPSMSRCSSCTEIKKKKWMD